MIVRKLRFVQADVFSDSPFGGNPVVVVADAAHLTTNEMQNLARGMNFAETVFVVAPAMPEADFGLRCFTPTTEVAYSGHALLGATYVLALDGRLPQADPGTELVVELARTLYPVAITAWEADVARLATLERPAEFGPTLDDYSAVAAALALDPLEILQTGLPVQKVCTGLPCLIVPIHSLAAVRDMMPVSQVVEAMLQPMEALCVLAFSRHTLSPASDVHVRVFAPSLGIPEDPATGTANGALAAYLARHEAVGNGPLTRLRSEQGTEMGRPSVIEIELDAATEPATIRVGGRVARSVEGSIFY